MNKHIALYCCIYILAGGAVYAESIGLGETIDLAIQNNPSIKAMQQKLNISDARIIIANTKINPALISDNGIAEQTYRLGIEQVFEVGDKRHKRKNLALAEKEIVYQEINTTVLDLRNKVRRAYIQLFQAQQKYSIASEILATTQSLTNIAQKKYKAGSIANLDVIQTSLSELNAANDLSRAKLDIAQSFNALNTLTGYHLNTDIILISPSLIDYTSQNKDIDSLIQIAYAYRPELKIIKKNALVLDRQLDISKANRIPNLSVAAGSDKVSGRNTSVFFIGRVELPLFNRQEGQIAEILAKKNELNYQEDAMENQIMMETQDAFYRLKVSYELINRYQKELIPKSLTIIQKSRRSFEEGKSGIITPIMAQQSYINIQLGYIEAMTQYQNSLSDLERSIGVGL